MEHEISSEFGELESQAQKLMDDVFAACDRAAENIEPEYVCMLMITTFGKSLFAHLCQDHAEEFWLHAISTVNEEHGVEL
jgi:hypothetical protein